MTRASLIIVSWNGEAYLPSCLESLVGEVGRDDELIVVDNGSSDGSTDLVRTRYPGAMLIENQRNLGFAGGANVGIRAAHGEFILLVNQDVFVADGWLEALLAALEPSDVGVAGCKLLYPDGRIQHAGGVLHYPLAVPAHRGYRELDRGQCDREMDVDYVTGASLAIRRTVLEEVGLFDEGFHPGFYEETDLCSRARSAGHRVVYTPFAVATHHETTSMAREETEYHRWMARGRLRYVLKHYSPTQFHRDFAPAERLWGASLPRREMHQGLRMAYLDTLLALRTIPRTGVLSDEGGAEAVAETLASLREALSRFAAETRPSLTDQMETAEQYHLGLAPPSHGVRSEGHVRAWLRRLKMRILSTWYVRSLLAGKELALVYQNLAAQDREASEAHRMYAQAIYGARAALDQLEVRVGALEDAREGEQKCGEET